MPKKTFREHWKGCEDYNLYINIYQIYVDHNKAVDGDAYLKMALELEPQDGEDCYHRGRIYEYEKNYEAARDELKTAMEQGYEDAMLLLGRGISGDGRSGKCQIHVSGISAKE
mgnify:CR=1 FL=1